MGKRKWSDEDLKKALATSISYAEIVRKLGLRTYGGNWGIVKNACTVLNLDTSYLLGQGHGKGRTTPKNKRSLEDVMVENSNYCAGHLKVRLLKNGLLKNECSLCGQKPEWKNKKLVMVIDHINGINNDNRLNNLRLLCPNCNSQQPTFSRGKKRN